MNKKQRNRQEKWDRRFLSLCQHISEWSKDPSTKVGAIITDDIKVISLGFNGLPQQIPDFPELLNCREIKYKHIIHAETNAILTAHRNLSGCTIYTFPFLPCTRCASEIVQSGISRVVSITCREERWKRQLAESREFMKLCTIEVAEYTTL